MNFIHNKDVPISLTKEKLIDFRLDLNIGISHSSATQNPNFHLYMKIHIPQHHPKISISELSCTYHSSISA